MGPRLLITTELIAPYRIPEFNALAARGDVDLHVIFLADTDPTMRHWHVYKDEIRFSHEVLPSRRWRLGDYNILVNRGMARALKASSPEVIVCGGYNYPASWQVLLWARTHRVPLLLWSESNARDARSNNTVVEFLKRYFLGSCDGFVVPGVSSMQYLKEVLVGECPIFTAPNAVDNTLFSEFAEKARGNAASVRARYHLPFRFFLFVGRLIRSKGVFELLDAYSQLDPAIRTNVGLVFVGSGDAELELARRGSRISPGDVHCVGFVQRDQLPEFYALAEAFIFPTHSDPWGFVVNEAMACGLPVIATNVAGCVADLVENGWNGFVVPPCQVAPLKEAMEVIATNLELREQMAMHTRERIQLYSPPAWATGMAQTVKVVVSQ